jgi:hypothetical protein
LPTIYIKYFREESTYMKTVLKDGVLSAFEHHCAGCYNLPFTGFILIPIGANVLGIYN